MIRHKDYLRKQLKNPRFKETYERELFIVRVSERIARLRERKGMTQEALAKRLGVKASMVSRIEAGRQNLTLESLHRIARALSTRVRVEIGVS